MFSITLLPSGVSHRRLRMCSSTLRSRTGKSDIVAGSVKPLGRRSCWASVRLSRSSRWMLQHAGICYVLLALPGREGLRLHPHQFEEVQHPLGKKEAEVVLVELCLCSILIRDYKCTSFHGIYLNGWIFLSYQTRIFAGEPNRPFAVSVFCKVPEQDPLMRLDLMAVYGGSGRRAV